jgi:hypothetical protein
MSTKPDQRFLVMAVEEIRNGEANKGTQAGWAVGPWFQPTNIRRAERFEVKEWNSNQIQSEWRDHSAAGIEYITVKQGTLIVILGQADDAKVVSEDQRIPVPANYCIVLSAGVWRRFEGDPDVQGVSVRSPLDARQSVDLVERYRAITEHWKHTDQVRQWLLYNFLLAMSVLVLAWATIISSKDVHALIPASLTVLGILVSLLWIHVVRRASAYYEMYEQDARGVERQIRDSENWPFHKRRVFQGSWLPFKHAIQLLPLLFLVFFFALMFIPVVHR